jgi:tRNA uridine 5-carboxymethylaminomethyl modification enzyme
MGRDSFDVLVIGGGHAGAEAAWAAAQLGARTAMVTFQREAIGRMSCNPAIGGIGKGQMVRELDALGGLMGIVTDETGIQFRMLNRRKGPAVWAPRAQADREIYAATVRRQLEDCHNLTIIEAGVEEIDAEPSRADEPQSASSGSLLAPRGSQRRITGVTLTDGRRIRATSVVITSGTFLRALMHCGEAKTCGGRIGEPAAAGLSASLASLGLELGRLKTGTPPRVARGSVDLDRLTPQPGDEEPAPFSHMTERIPQPQVPCWITHTNPAVHELIRANLHRAPMYSGQIQSRGPRYCPSIEDKVVRFSEKDRHQVFLEPEGRESERIYVNGISTSLPQDVQARIVASIEGLETARVLQWGYAVEYDFVLPEQLFPSLMTKRVRGLFLAGQINGTSGYEEAAGQGIVAGINAARYAAGLEPVILKRDEAYIGVMIDDLVTRGVTEPYRMFTSRAEHRLHLRYDNADVRLTPLGRELGLVKDDRWARFGAKSARMRALRTLLESTRANGRSLAELLKRPEIELDQIIELCPALAQFRREADIWGRTQVEIKYAGYIERQKRVIEEFRQLEDRLIPDSLDFAAIPQLRREALERWNAVRPRSVGQAARVSGIHPTDVTMLLVHLAALGGNRASGEAA